MKKFFFLLMSAVVLAGFTACDNKDSDKDSDKASVKATEKTVLKYLPGKWKAATEIAENGKKYKVEQSIIFTFGKEGVDVPEGHGSTSSIAGKYSMEHNGYMVVRRGRWNIEPSPEDPGVFAYLHDDEGEMMNLPNGRHFFFIKTIGEEEMQLIMEEGNPAGYVLTRID